MKKVGIFIGFMLWTLLCIYGTYWNTVKCAEMTAISEKGYEITYHNTGEVYTYER